MNSKLYGGMLALVGAIMFSTKAIFVKLAYNYDVDSVSLLMLRMLFSLPVFVYIGYISLSNRTDYRKQLSQNKWKVIGLGILGYYAASYFDLEGLLYIDASLERVILFMYPTMVVIFNYLFFKERISLVQLMAIILTYTGIIIAFSGNLIVNEAQSVVKGAVLVSIAAVTYSIYIVGTGSLATKVGTKVYNSIAMSAASIAIILHSLILHGFNLFDFVPQVYIYALLISIFSTIIPSYIIVEGIRIIGANNSSIIGSFGPVSTILMAIVILNEKISGLQWAGSLIVVVGVILILGHKPRLKTMQQSIEEI